MNVTLTGKIQRWKLYLQDNDFCLCRDPRKEVHQFVPDALSRLCDNHMLANESEKPAHKQHQAFLATLEPKHRISDAADSVPSNAAPADLLGQIAPADMRPSRTVHADLRAITSVNDAITRLSSSVN